MTPLAAYLLLFIAVGVGFIFVHLVAGKLLRPSKPHSEKATIYECGEPTIGSAWIQFDLRFYVVALLFVVFDVEVAFFFPWAEVFGKANAVANAPDPKTAAEYNDLGEKILDLALPSDSAAAVGSQARWKKMRTITDDELKAYQSLTEAQLRSLRSMTREQMGALVALTPEQRLLIGQSDAALRAAFAAQMKKRDAALRPILEAARKRPSGPGKVPALVDAEHRSAEPSFDTMKLADLASGNVAIMAFARPPVGPTPENALRKEARELDPAALAAVVALSNEQVADWKPRAAGILVALRKAGPDQMASWNALTPATMKELGALSEDQADAMSRLSTDAVRLLSEPTVRDAKAASRTLAWLALGEILVFFGVLLVGFAYLWKRGDLAWVRATVAEQGQYPISTPPTILAATRPLGAAGEHAGS